MAPPQTIFPKHIPGVCHPNVNSTLSLIHDLEHDEDSKSSSSSSTDKASQESLSAINNSSKNRKIAALNESELNNLQINSKSLRRIKQIGLNCEPFLHKSNLYRIQLENIKLEADKVGDDSKYTKRKMTEFTALMKVFEMNYKYCVASESCPRRMNGLNRCFQRYKPELVNSLLQVGRHDLICMKEKRAVERCVAQQIMNFANDAC